MKYCIVEDYVKGSDNIPKFMYRNTSFCRVYDGGTLFYYFSQINTFNTKQEAKIAILSSPCSREGCSIVPLKEVQLAIAEYKLKNV